MLQPLAVAAEDVEVAGSAEAVEAVDAAPAAVVVEIGFEVVAAPHALASVEKEIAAASGPGRCHRPVSASWNRARCPRSSPSHRRSRLLARSSCGIAARQLRLPRSSSAATNGPAPQ